VKDGVRERGKKKEEGEEGKKVCRGIMQKDDSQGEGWTRIVCVGVCGWNKFFSVPRLC